MRSAFAVIAAWMLTASTAVGAQRPDTPAGFGDRRLLEQRVRERFADVVRQRVGLSDEQMRRLTETNRKFEGQRRTLVEQERDIRIGLRSEVLAGDRANQERVARLLDQMLRVQRDRVALLEQEQRELAAFMTPVQRARYLGVQDQIRRTIEDMRRRRQQQGSSRGARERSPR
jgi:periplasmic protein CpxP/Spy